MRLISVALSENYQKKGNPIEIETASKIVPDDASNYFRLGLIYHKSLLWHDAKKAVERYRASLERNPLDSKVWYNLALAYISMDKKEEAFSAMENFRRLGSSGPENIWGAGVFYLVYGGNIKEYQDLFRQYMEIEPASASRVYNILKNADSNSIENVDSH
jgi:tetratricopeptide (TPR) repeat protein